MHNSKELAFTFIMMLVFSLFCLIVTAHYIWPTAYHWPREGGRGGGLLSIVPASTLHQKNIRNFKHPKKYLKF